jgi:uncharacterized protein
MAAAGAAPSVAPVDRAAGNASRRADATGAGDLLHALSEPATYGLDDPVEVRETHASWVFLAGAWAFKIKKPVKLAFLDYSTLERRGAACREELRVNRALGGDIYRRVLAIVDEPGGIRFATDGTPGAIEYALQMRRFDENLTLAGLIAAERLTERQLDGVARRLARFHAEAPVQEGGGAGATLRTWRTNLDELERLEAPVAKTAAVRCFGEAFVAAHGDEIDRRAQAGLVRDGHGDLRCEHVLLDGDVRVLDRIEFDPGLRHIDVGCDLAFLLMDLERCDQGPAARRLLDAYRGAGGDPGTPELVWFFAAYWALVRAKVALIAEMQRAAGSEPVSAGALLRLAERLSWRARGAVAIAVAGPPGSGKSTLAGAVAERSGLAVLSSDVTRKRLAGLAPTQRASPEHYTARFTAATYRTLGEAAAETLSRGEGVVIDATCATRAERADLLRALGVAPGRLMFVECRVPLECAIERAAARAEQPTRVSDAAPEVVARLFESYEPIDEIPQGTVVAVDGRAPLDEQLGLVAATLDELLRGDYVVRPDRRRVSAAGGPPCGP